MESLGKLPQRKYEKKRKKLFSIRETLQIIHAWKKS